jgi:hypothetical protein
VPEVPFDEGGLDLAGVAATLGFPEDVVARLVRAGLMPGVGVGSLWFCSPEHLDQWMAAEPSTDEERRLREVLAETGVEA